MKGPLALVMYCVLFSTLFLLFYTFMSGQDGENEMARRSDSDIRRSGDGGRPHFSKFSKSDSSFRDQSLDNAPARYEQLDVGGYGLLFPS